MFTKNVSRETLDDLQRYVDLIKKWNPRINLVSNKSIDDIWDRHIWDSWQIVEHRPQDSATWLDIGSGGGLPGLVVAIHAKHNDASTNVALLESDGRKCQFLRTVIRELSLPATVETARIELANPYAADVISSRALADLSKLLEYADRHLTEQGRLIVHKGGRFQEEIHNAQENWDFDIAIHPSMTDKSAAILEIGSIKNAK